MTHLTLQNFIKRPVSEIFSEFRKIDMSETKSGHYPKWNWIYFQDQECRLQDRKKIVSNRGQFVFKIQIPDDGFYFDDIGHRRWSLHESVENFMQSTKVYKQRQIRIFKTYPVKYFFQDFPQIFWPFSYVLESLICVKLILCNTR